MGSTEPPASPDQSDKHDPNWSGGSSTLRRWKSLEGDWRTFLCPTDQSERYSKESRNYKSASESLMRLDGCIGSGFPNRNSPQKCADYREGDSESDWGTDNMALRYEDDRSCSSDISRHFVVEPSFQESFHGIDREELQTVVTSSYPLLEENFSLLQKLKKERDVCRQLENDMKDLEGQIQHVSKSFHTASVVELDSREGSCDDSEADYASEENVESTTPDGSYEQMFVDSQDNHSGQTETTELLEDDLDPITVIESTLSSLMDLAERLELAVRERDMQMRRMLQGSSLLHISTEWTRPSLELSRIPSELVDLLQDLQVALRLLLASKGTRHHHPVVEWCRQREDRECSSPASFTFESFGDGRVLVPTVRTIFSPVGDSVEMRPIQEQPTVESYDSTSSLGESCETKEHFEPAESNSEECHEEMIDNYQHKEEPPVPEDPLIRQDIQDCPQPSNVSEHQPSADIIKRIERLQELMKPELRESLKQRALKIQKAKEDFLSGLVNLPAAEEVVQRTDILIEDVTEPSPNGLTVKEQTDDKRAKLPFLRKKKHQSWTSEELCRQSLVLEDKPDWLRNPFRPKGKYKISK